MSNIELKAPELDEQREELFSTWRYLAEWLDENSSELFTATLVGFGILLVLVIVRSLLTWMLGGPKATGWRGVLQNVIGRTRSFFMVMVAVELVTMQAVIPRRASDIIDVLFVIAAAVQAAIWIRALVIGFVEQKVGEGEEHRTLGTAVGLIRVLVTVVAFLIAGIVILDNVGLDVTGLVAGLGIGGIAIGLAAQGIFSDLFAAIAIILDRPFRKGDTVNVGGPPNGFVGTVENIGLKTTRLRALDGELVAFGNAELLKNRVHNFALQERRRVVFRFGIIYQTPPDMVAQIPDELRAIVQAQPLGTFDRAHAFQFGASSIDFELIFYVETADYAEFMQTRHDIMIGLMRRFEEMDIDFAYPTQMTFTAGPDGRPVAPGPAAITGS